MKAKVKVSVSGKMITDTACQVGMEICTSTGFPG